MGVSPSFRHIQLRAMEKSDFKYLVNKYLAGKTTAEEERKLLHYYDSLQTGNIPWNAEEMGVQEDIKKKIYQNALNKIRRQEIMNKPAYTRSPFPYWKMAAAMLVAAFASIYLYIREPGQKVAHTDKSQTIIHDIPPGGNKAILTLADGKKIILDNTGAGTITTQGDIAVSKSKDGQLIYEFGKNNTDPENHEPVFNTISTPVGGQYQVVLSDDTRVWLNASSSIKFPTAFTKNERQVEIEGEAYFEVAKDKKRPFRVLTNGQKIEVLGTHFNVNAYKDEASIKTTLIEGSVKVVSGRSNDILKPGEQSRMSREDYGIRIVNVDVEEAAAWKNGRFMFDNEDIHSIMRKISRWYGVEVVYEDDNIHEKFGGTISRFENVSQVLKLLEITGTIHFKIVPGPGKGRRIIVMK